MAASLCTIRQSAFWLLLAHAVMFSSVEYAHYLSKSSIPLEVDVHSLKPHPVFCVPLLLSMGHSPIVISLKPVIT